MALPDLDDRGYLPPGLHAAPLAEVLARFATGSASRQRQGELLRQVVEAAITYPSIKRVLVWGSFVTHKPDPGDLDYSIVVSVGHTRTRIPAPDRRFLVPADARRYYGVDRGYLVVPDYPLEEYLALLEFICGTRAGMRCGIAEISVRGEVVGSV